MREFKRRQMMELAAFRDGLRRSPQLQWLFFEITDRCNLRCAHCGSRCTGQGTSLSLADVEGVLDRLDGLTPMICLTGGEPLLHPDFYEIGKAVVRHGLGWGMTTNATLIDDEAAARIREAGMSTVSVSLDGLEESHDRLRGRRGAWRDAIRGIQALQRAGFDPQVTSVFHRGNFSELAATYDFVRSLGVSSWRPINVEPIGRTCENNDLLLSGEELKELLHFIREKRFDRDNPMEVTFGCSHFLGVETERMVRDNYFLCGAGVYVASVRSNGDICACLDIANLPQLVQGNIRRDRFSEVWRNRFEIFRTDRTALCAECRACSDRVICGGDSAHTWDWENDRPLLCAAKAIGDHGQGMHP